MTKKAKLRTNRSLVNLQRIQRALPTKDKARRVVKRAKKAMSLLSLKGKKKLKMRKERQIKTAIKGLRKKIRNTHLNEEAETLSSLVEENDSIIN